MHKRANLVLKFSFSIFNYQFYNNSSGFAHKWYHWKVSLNCGAKTHLDRVDKGCQSKAERVWVDKAAERPNDVVLEGLRGDVYSGVLNHWCSCWMSRKTLHLNSLSWMTCRIHGSWVSCSLECRTMWVSLWLLTWLTGNCLPIGSCFTPTDYTAQHLTKQKAEGG